MDLSDVFGNFPSRPDHPDFWRLSSIVLKLDGRMTSAKTNDEKDSVWGDNIARWIDEDSATYTAMQRAMRPLGVETVRDAREHAQTLVLLTVVWMEGFQVGAEFATEGAPGKPLANAIQEARAAQAELKAVYDDDDDGLGTDNGHNAVAALEIALERLLDLRGPTFGGKIDDLNETELRLLLSNYEHHVKDCFSQGTEPPSVREWFAKDDG